MRTVASTISPWSFTASTRVLGTIGGPGTRPVVLCTFSPVVLCTFSRPAYKGLICISPFAMHRPATAARKEPEREDESSLHSLRSVGSGTGSNEGESVPAPQPSSTLFPALVSVGICVECSVSLSSTFGRGREGKRKSRMPAASLAGGLKLLVPTASCLSSGCVAALSARTSGGPWWRTDVARGLLDDEVAFCPRLLVASCLECLCHLQMPSEFLRQRAKHVLGLCWPPSLSLFEECFCMRSTGSEL
mmetsp:Transcript_8417/g.22870  ORF Transcript_8417/g.22870 Transcript_8417/m.22870 type:complete len:247 (+) Transcript_8417:282-1022(+)